MAFRSNKDTRRRTRGGNDDVSRMSQTSQPTRSSRSSAPLRSGGSQSRGETRTYSQRNSQQTRQTRNLWDIGDNPSPESGFSYVSTRDSYRPIRQQGQGGQQAARQGRTSQPLDSSRSKPTARNARSTQGAQPSLRTANPTVASANPDEVELVSERVGDIRQQERAKRLRASSRRYFLRIFLIIGIVVALLGGWAALYNSPVFSIEHVTVKGVEHLTSDEMAQLANVPSDTTLLRVDIDSIADRVRKNSWVQDVTVNRVFPDTLEIVVTERPVAAIVEIPVSQGSSVKHWAIAEDHMWLMPIPEAGSDAAKTTSSKIYEDEENILHIVGVPYGTKAEIGQVCSDENVNNALDIIGGMTTDLADRVVKISAAGTAETTLILDNGVEIAFGKAEDIRDKERVIQKILEENPAGVAYINVRMVENPTWRAI